MPYAPCACIFWFCVAPHLDCSLDTCIWHLPFLGSIEKATSDVLWACSAETGQFYITVLVGCSVCVRNRSTLVLCESVLLSFRLCVGCKLCHAGHAEVLFPSVVVSCLVFRCLVLSCLVLSCLVLSCLALPCLVLSWLVSFSCFFL